MNGRSERSPEERLVLLLARGEPTGAEQDAARSLLASDLDWAHVLRLAQRHEVLPLVCRNLQRLGFPGVPAEARAALEGGRRATAACNALLSRELSRVLRLLGGARIPTIPMKGVVLSETLYGDAGVRVGSDLDLLVPREHVARAFEVLRADGYRAEFTERFFARLLLRNHIEYTLVRRTHGFDHLVDLHWGMGWSPRVDRRAAEALWAESRPVTRSGVDVWAMSPEWELLTLAVHAARHGWEMLKWLVDIHEYCRTRDLDWPKLRATAERFGWLPALERTLGACQALLGTPAPPGIVPVVPAGLGAILDGESGRPRPEALVPLPLIERSPEKLRYLLRMLLVPTLAERRLLRLPSALGLLYYPLRPLRLGGKWGWRLLQAGAGWFPAFR